MDLREQRGVDIGLPRHRTRLEFCLDSVQLHEACLDQKILIAPGTVFSTSGRFRNCLRIGVGGDWSPAHLEALGTVGDMATRMLHSQREAA